MVSDLLLGVLQTHPHYRRKLRAVIVAKGGCKKVLNKRVTLIVASVNWRKTHFIEISPYF